MEDLENFNPKKTEFDTQSFKDGDVSWLTRFLLRIWPGKGLACLTREFGMDPEQMEKANSLFFNVKRVDIIPSESGERGFQIILDNATALYFNQEGDHFVYDGSETGEYDNGDTTIFDDLK